VKIAVILNGISLEKRKFYSQYKPLLEKHHALEIHETLTKNDAVAIAQKVTQKKFDIIIAAGGDGTVHQVVNGMLDGYSLPTKLPVLAILPLGSGNDFAKAIPADSSPGGFARRIDVLSTRTIDVGEVSYAVSAPEAGVTSMQDRRYFVNVVDVGMGPNVVRGVNDSGRAFGSAVAYYKSILKTFLTFKAVALHAAGSGWEWRSKCKCLAVANAKYFGDGLCVAPEANLNDGVLDVFAVGDVSAFDFILQTIPLKRSRKVKHSKVFYYKSTAVSLNSEQPMEIEADGEIVGWLPANVRFSPYKLQILA
jgi:diacylglycerol kinase (ATP)